MTDTYDETNTTIIVHDDGDGSRWKWFRLHEGEEGKEILNGHIIHPDQRQDDQRYVADVHHRVDGKRFQGIGHTPHSAALDAYRRIKETPPQVFYCDLLQQMADAAARTDRDMCRLIENAAPDLESGHLEMALELRRKVQKALNEITDEKAFGLAQRKPRVETSKPEPERKKAIRARKKYDLRPPG